MDASNAAATAIRGRWAVAAIFFVNGFVTGSWAPQIPVFLTRLDISEFTLGLLILLFGAGAVSAMVWAGHLIPKHGSKTVTSLFAVAGSFGLLLVALAPNVPVAARRHVHLRRHDRRDGRLDERQRRYGGEEARPRDHVVLARLLEPRRLRRRRARRHRHPELRAPRRMRRSCRSSAIAIVAFSLRHLVADLPVAQEHKKFVAAAQPDGLCHRRDGAACR